MKHYLIEIILLISIIVLSIFLLKSCNKEIEYKPIVIHDTIRIDSVRIEEHTKIEYVAEFDTLLVVEKDTIKDTIYFQIPIEHKEYKDTFLTDTSKTELNIKYSGFKTSLDEISIVNHYYSKEPLKTKKLHIKPSFNIGIGGGYGVGIREGCLKPEPQIGIYGTVGFSVVKY